MNFLLDRSLLVQEQKENSGDGLANKFETLSMLKNEEASNNMVSAIFMIGLQRGSAEITELGSIR